MLSCWLSGRPRTSGELPASRRGWVGSWLPPTVEPLASVLTEVKAPKSGFGLRLLPVSGACDRPKPPRMTIDIDSGSRPKTFIFGL